MRLLCNFKVYFLKGNKQSLFCSKCEEKAETLKLGIRKDGYLWFK